MLSSSIVNTKFLWLPFSPLSTKPAFCRSLMRSRTFLKILYFCITLFILTAQSKIVRTGTLTALNETLKGEFPSQDPDLIKQSQTLPSRSFSSFVSWELHRQQLTEVRDQQAGIRQLSVVGCQWWVITDFAWSLETVASQFCLLPWCSYIEHWCPFSVQRNLPDTHSGRISDG